jgi:predicted enzyme related to lactoylglutathione lyase
MTVEFLGISFDSPDAQAIAHFWAEVLGRTVADGATAEFAAVSPADNATGPLLMFHQVPEPKTVKNRIHLDLKTNDFATETEHLLNLGATRVTDIKADGENVRWTTFADPDGNEFDLVNS